MSRPPVGGGISTANRVTFLERVKEGATLQQAASVAGGFDRTSFRDLAERDPEFAGQLAEARNEGVGRRADIVDQRFDEWVDQDNCAPALRIVWAKRWNPAYRERQDVTVEHAGTVTVEDRSATLADVARVLEAVGALAEIGVGAARPEVPDARALLPAPPHG